MAAYGLNKRVGGGTASAESDVLKVVDNYRREMSMLRTKYVKERDDFLASQIGKLVQP